MVQETHSSNKLNLIWKNEWSNRCIFSNGTSQSRGVATLFNKGSRSYVKKVVSDANGRYILCKLEISDTTYCLANVYAPNLDSPQFLEELLHAIF